jgi:hypothetical protein
MSEKALQTQVEQKTQQLLQGSLKHVRAAALAAALLPLASIAVAPAAAQGTDGLCPSGGLCGFVWNDTDSDGFQDAGEPGIEGASVTVTVLVEGEVIVITRATNTEGFYYFDLPPGPYEIFVQIPNATEPSPLTPGSDPTLDSDGVPDGIGNSVASVTVPDGGSDSYDFGFSALQVAKPGTGTPGYWKNHPEAWPTETIVVGVVNGVGGVSYSKALAISWLETVGKDKTITMFSSLVPAILNVRIGTDASCIQSTIDEAHAWMAKYGPVGRGVHASSFAWKIGEPLHRRLDNYNNGMLCAPHRD